MSRVITSREMCEIILASTDASAAEKRSAKVRLDELTAGDPNRLYIRLDGTDAPPDRAAIVDAIKKMDPHFADSPSLSLSYLQGRLDQMRSAKAVSGTTTTPSATTRTDSYETALIAARNASATAWCSTDAERTATVARLDSATARRAELDNYRAQRAEESRLDSNTEQPLSPVVRAQIEYYRRQRGGNFGGNDAA